ncbi:MAG TPA: hypothetical protein VMP01_17415 [Pirellulaceae bacterium]|nr:hypothetical protein [Pirellulaceae bacterium]
MLRLARPDRQSAGRQIHVVPAQRQQLAGHAQAAIAGQSDDCPPLVVWGRVNGRLNLLPSHKLLPSPIAAYLCRQLGKGVDVDQAQLDGRAEKLLGESAPPADGVFAQLVALQVAGVRFRRQPHPPRFGIAGGNVAQVFASAEEFN